MCSSTEVDYDIHYLWTLCCKAVRGYSSSTGNEQRVKRMTCFQGAFILLSWGFLGFQPMKGCSRGNWRRHQYCRTRWHESWRDKAWYNLLYLGCQSLHLLWPLLITWSQSKKHLPQHAEIPLLGHQIMAKTLFICWVSHGQILLEWLNIEAQVQKKKVALCKIHREFNLSI